MKEEACIDCMEKIRSIEQWRNGNGSKGAEKRIQEIEDTLEKLDRKMIWMLVFMGIIIVQQVPALVGIFMKAVIP